MKRPPAYLHLASRLSNLFSKSVEVGTPVICQNYREKESSGNGAFEFLYRHYMQCQLF